METQLVGEDFHVTEKKIAHVHLPQNELQGDLPTKVSKKERNKDEEDDSRALIECELSPLTSVETLELKNKSVRTYIHTVEKHSGIIGNFTVSTVGE